MFRFRDKEVNLNCWEIIFTAILIIFCVIGAYVIGYRQGQRYGFDLAMKETALTLERIPVAENFRKEPTVEDVSNIYARITDQEVPKKPKKEGKEDEVTKNAIKLINKKDLKGWYVQVLATKKLKEGEELMQTLKKSGFDVLIESLKMGEENYFRVLSGPESSEVYAERLKDQIKREKLVSNEPFTREY